MGLFTIYKPMKGSALRILVKLKPLMGSRKRGATMDCAEEKILRIWLSYLPRARLKTSWNVVVKLKFKPRIKYTCFKLGPCTGLFYLVGEPLHPLPDCHWPLYIAMLAQIGYCFCFLFGNIYSYIKTFAVYKCWALKVVLYCERSEHKDFQLLVNNNTSTAGEFFGSVPWIWN